MNQNKSKDNIKPNQIETPTTFIDIQKCVQNVKNMVERMEDPKSQFRPHFKTHQSTQLAKQLFTPHGITKCTVSSISMAQYFFNDGWKDITIAAPINIREIYKIDQLLKDGAQINVILDNLESAQILSQKIYQKGLGLFIEIDMGQGRSGINVKALGQKGQSIINSILKVVNESEEKIIFKGFLNHSGQSYGTFNDKQKKLDIYETSKTFLNNLKKQYQEQYPDIIISFGCTPVLTQIDKIKKTDFDELRPGNFVFFDYQQYMFNSCKLEDISISVACPVVSKFQERQEIVIYGGGIHISKDFQADENQQKHYGLPVFYDEKTGSISEFLKNSRVVSASQEFSVVSIEKEYFDKIQVGSVIGILPSHSCMVVDLFPVMRDLEGNPINTLNQWIQK